MKIIEQRFLRGPNLYAFKPCLLSIIDLQDLDEINSAQLPGFTERLIALMPSIWEHRCSEGCHGGFVQRLHDGTYMAHVVEHVCIELQCLAGNVVAYGRAREVKDRPRHYRVVCAYKSERVVARALDLAIEMVEALAKGKDFSLDIPLLALRALAERCSIGTSTAAVIDAARRRGIPVTRLTEDANLFQLGWGHKQQRIQATTTSKTNLVATNIASDKQLTKTLLVQAGLPVPAGETVNTLADAIDVAQSLGDAVTIKPLDANQGKGVTTICSTQEEIAAAFELAQAHSPEVIVERYLPGRDYRVLVAGGRVVAAAWRRPPSVTGDGESTVRELVEVENRDPSRGDGHANVLTRIPIDAVTEAALRRQGFHLDSVLPAGISVDLRGNANLSTGGTADDVTDLVHPETLEACVRAAATIGLDIAGIDIVCLDIARPLEPQGGGIIEVNAAPGIRMHEYPYRGIARDAGGAIVESLFGSSDGRIPVISITGTNGKTTTTLLAAHIARGTGAVTGVTTTNGVYIDDRVLQEGDCTGYHSARMVLTSPEVEFAVLETARGGILKRGLGYDRCTVSVVLNVTDDHLGLDGVENVDDLARVKEVVAASAGKAVVLNAEDDRCVEMASRLAAELEILYFSLDPDNPVLLRHLQLGGRAVYLQDNWLVLAGGERHTALLDVRDMPVSLEGHARFNIANAMAATLAMLAAGVGTTDIAQGLCTFVSDGRSNPLRSNLFDVDGVTVIVDYAHNCAAFAAMAETARTMTAGQLVGIVSAPGDRREVDLHAIGRTCAAGFDELVVYETENRGRPDGETARMILEGARGAISTERLHCRRHVHDAIRHGLSLCKRGDILVFGAGTSFDELTEALRPLAPHIAERITAETT